MIAGVGVDMVRIERMEKSLGSEAFLKACGKGLGGFALADIQVLRAESGAPYYALKGAAAAHMAENGLHVSLSLSHEDGLAAAFAVLEKG